MRDLDTKHHLEGESIVHSNGQAIDLDVEPVFLLRAQDRLAVDALEHYRTLCLDDHCTVDQLLAVQVVVERFKAFRRTHPEAMELPGIPQEMETSKGETSDETGHEASS